MFTKPSDNPPAPEPTRRSVAAKPEASKQGQADKPQRSAYKPVRAELAPYGLEYWAETDASPARLHMTLERQRFAPDGQPLSNPYVAFRQTYRPEDEVEVAKLQTEMEVELIGQLGAQLSQPIPAQIQVPDTKSGEGAKATEPVSRA